MQQTLLAGILLLVFPLLSFAQPTVTFVPVNLTGGSLVSPVDIENNGVDANKLFILEKRGTIKIIEGNQIQPDLFLDIESLVSIAGNEQGLLGIAFHPDFPTAPFYYIYYIDNSGDTKIVRYTVAATNSDSTILASAQILIEVDQPDVNHNGGDMAFGPDGYLYISLGDGGGGGDQYENGQNLQSLLGTILRIDVNSGSPYGIPPDNPFVGNENALDEIWAYGLRNPWRMGFDRATGDLWIADVGQNLWEEINVQPASSTGGENYGWPCFEGNHAFENEPPCPNVDQLVFPVFEYPHGCGEGCPFGTGRSVTGGFVYRGPTYLDLQGIYICADYISDNFWLLENTGSGYDTTMQSGSGTINNLSTFGEALNGELYAAGTDGGFYQITADGLLPVTIIDFRATIKEDDVLLQWKFADLDDAETMYIERSAPGMEFREITQLPSPSMEGSYIDVDPDKGTQFYRIKILEKDGAAWYSALRSVSFPGDTKITFIRQSDRMYHLHYALFQPATLEFEVHSSSGQMVKSFIVEAEEAGNETISFSELPAGIYFVSTNHEGMHFAEKIVLH